MVVLVGPKKDKFTVQKAFLVKSSDFFRACFDGGWKESETKTIELPDTDSDIFSIYVQWLLTNELVVTEDGVAKIEGDMDQRDQKARQHYKPLFHLAVFADKHRDMACTNAINDSIINVIETSRLTPSIEYLKLAYDTLSARSKTLNILVDRFASTINPEQLRSNVSEYPHNFLHQVWIAFFKAQGSNNGLVPKPTTVRRCMYHEHNVDVPRDTRCVDWSV